MSNNTLYSRIVEEAEIKVYLIKIKSSKSENNTGLLNLDEFSEWTKVASNFYSEVTISNLIYIHNLPG